MIALLFQKTLVFPILLVSFALLLVACDREEEDPLSPEDIAQLNGRWRIISYKIAGQEQMGSLVEGGALAFSPEGDVDGRFIQVVKFAGELAEDVIRGAYVIDVDDSQLRLSYDDDVFIVDIDIEGEDLIWSGTLGGSSLDIIATKRP